ncbi:MAG: YbaK/EbsC family protein [Streptosporangiaceae bacterium]
MRSIPLISLDRSACPALHSRVFEAAGDPLLVLASGAHRVDTAKLAQRLGSGKIGRAAPAFVFEHTGQHVGGVAPTGIRGRFRPLSTPHLRRLR